MYGIDTPSAVATLPTPLTTGTQGFYQNKVEGVSSATQLSADAFNHIQQELLNLLNLGEAQGITPTTPSKSVYNQIQTHIERWGEESTGNTDASYVTVTQVNHGFPKYSVLRASGGTYSLASSSLSDLPVGIVSEVYSQDSFQLTIAGRVPWNTPNIPDFVVGSVLYLTTAGTITTLKPASNVKVVGYSTNDGLLVRVFGEVKIDVIEQDIAVLNDDYDSRTGMISPYAGSVAPAGYLPCNGSAISRTVYSELFAKIGVSYGAGNGSTTFNLPNFEGMVLKGSTATRPVGSFEGDMIRNITGSVTKSLYYGWPYGGTPAEPTTTGAYEIGASRGNLNVEGGNNWYYSIRDSSFDASRSVPTGPENTVKNFAVLYCIKY